MKIRRAPTRSPPFTLRDIKQKIPDHCFDRSTLHSFAYLLFDLSIISLLVYLSSWIDSLPVSPFFHWTIFWPIYWYTCGAIATGVWVIGHECGHGAFSKSPVINDCVGFIVHSLLLVPYFSWKHSHRRHHSNTANLAKDEVFVPRVKSHFSEELSIESWAFVAVIRLIITFILGWPMYLIFNASGRPYPSWANHFSPYSPIYSPKERLEVILSDIGLVVVFTGLAALGNLMGWSWLLKTYFIPYLIVNFWLVLITLLQHTHPALPHYYDESWDWLRGALSTVDRDYGVLNLIFHRITDTHVVHHLFSKIPHYHAKEATEAVKLVLGDYYQQDSRNVFKALWHDWTNCRFVAPDSPGQKVLWFRK
eukprot:g700.t1